MPAGPGIPFEIALKLMAKRKMKEDELKNGKKPMTEQDMLDEASEMYGRIAQSKRLTGIDANTSNTSSPYKETISKEQLIKEGLFVEKDGDLIPTQKYFDFKKSGKLKGKYNIS